MHKINKGDKFGRLTIIEELNSHVMPSGQKARKFLCQCDCNNKVEVFLSNLIHKRTKSCGCLQIERTRKKNKTHGMVNSIYWKTWRGMKQRCTLTSSKDYKNYGECGIKVYEPWSNSFELFYKYIMTNLGPRPKGYSIDRIDVNGNYEPGNIRWADSRTQTQNRKRKPGSLLGAHKDGNKFVANIVSNKKHIRLGTYNTAEEAHKVYLSAEKIIRADPTITPNELQNKLGIKIRKLRKKKVINNE